MKILARARDAVTFAVLITAARFNARCFSSG
jgi:hypothetical protein